MIRFLVLVSLFAASCKKECLKILPAQIDTWKGNAIMPDNTHVNDFKLIISDQPIKVKAILHGGIHSLEGVWQQAANRIVNFACCGMMKYSAV